MITGTLVNSGCNPVSYYTTFMDIDLRVRRFPRTRGDEQSIQFVA